MLKIIGGTYFEVCEDPNRCELYGSGLRAAAALSDVISDINFISCGGKDDKRLIESICDTFNVKAELLTIEKTFSFYYYHPLSPPNCYPEIEEKVLIPNVEGDNILYYGMIDANVSVFGDYVVYDPQNGIRFKDTGSQAKHLALILNKNEALQLSGLTVDSELKEVGKSLLASECAEVVVIKNGSHGALVIDSEGFHQIPIFETSSVWPIGSGDIFSAAFAWKWIFEKEAPKNAANNASLYTAQYCESRALPIKNAIPQNKPLPVHKTRRKIYLAGPFFSIAERWLINELRDTLLKFDNDVFSPMHDAGLGTTKEIIQKDINAIENSDVLLVIADGRDLNTFFELGYARALNKRIIILSENVQSSDLIMASSTGCEIVNDFSTAVYKASW